MSNTQTTQALVLKEEDRREWPHEATAIGKCAGCGKMWDKGDAYWLIRYDGVAAWACASVNCHTPPQPSAQDSTEIAAPASEASYVEPEQDAVEDEAFEGPNSLSEFRPAADVGPQSADVVLPSADDADAEQPAFQPAADADVRAVVAEVVKIEAVVEEMLTKPVDNPDSDAVIRPNPAKVGMYVKFVWDALHSK